MSPCPARFCPPDRCWSLVIESLPKPLVHFGYNRRDSLSAEHSSGILEPLQLMDGSALDNEQRYSICPQCEGRVRGQAATLVMGHGGRTMHYVCTVCFHEWHHAVPLPDSSWIFRRPADE